ncbi:unnamed protein product [Rotaria sordida]|uniref:DUF4371 domain-containing protein n=1 Tax=Rotaria sordida TaxID=392033 RepID=A0A819AL96_9BILA|nr:unnamed protein product [Rotaria sordida]CAF1343120.1 unnamed protein product [Rotaria sordida]CAF3771759.1 unnamed protein product [Rotaria sordida]CAF3783829.1 unnamed protein product [Rotaria sordida]
MEAFTKNSDHFADALIQAESDLKQSCTGILSTIELNRNRTTITQRKEDKMINRDPGYYERNHKFTEEQLRYFVSVGPFQHRLHKFPKNKVLEAAKTTCVTIERLIVNEINQSPFISIMIDSTPDLSHREMYSIVIRYTKYYQVKERLLSLQELPSKIGEDIFQLLLDTLRQKGISTDKIIGQCYENAFNMSGVNKGVQACINKQLNREIMHIPCEAHTSNLAVQHACDCSIEFINVFIEIIDCLESIELVESKQFDKETKTQIAEKFVEPFNINIDQEFDRLHRLRQRSRRIDVNPSTAVQLTRELFYIKLFRQVLDHLHTTYHDYIQVMIEKLRYFQNLTPYRIQQLIMDDCR